MSRQLPAVDERAVEPETATEMIDGRVMRVLPAEPPHADRQCGIAMVLKADVAPGYVAATELLTRVDRDSDFATDVGVRRAGRDPETGSRYLEEISFEVQHTQSEADITARARKLVGRGVRRVFCIKVREDAAGMVQAGPVREWLADEERWQELAPESEIADGCLFRPIKVQALLDAAAADDQVGETLWEKQNPALMRRKQEALDAQKKALDRDKQRALEAQKKAHDRQMQEREKELADALAQARAATLDLCEVLAIEVTADRRARMDAMTGEELTALRHAIRSERAWPKETR